MKLQRSCDRCKAPMFLNRTIDWYGNTVVTRNCWNGHYEWVRIEDIEEFAMENEVTVKENPVVHIGFVDVT